jgi:hypothetical protein
MSLAARIALAAAVLLVDVVSFFVPLGALVIAWVILTRPRWALALVARLYADVEFGGPPADAPPPADG